MLALVLAVGLAQGACAGVDGPSSPEEALEGGEGPGAWVESGSVAPELELLSGDAPTAPLGLTSTDGTGLVLAAMNADVAIEEPFALTQLHLVFDNPEDRTLEGRFEIDLPEGASLSRLAMKIGDTWQEGEVVEKQRARVTYEQFLHQRKDPALLEQGVGNRVSLRIFPIQARERRELVVTYSETLSSTRPYRLRLRGLPSVGKLDARVHASGKPVASLLTEGKAPLEDLLVGPAERSSSPTVAVRAGRTLAMRVKLPGGAASADPLERAIVLFDTSASRALDLDAGLRSLRAVVASMPREAPLVVACFDQEVSPVYEGTAGGFDDWAIERIRLRGALGASDLSGALAWAGAKARTARVSGQRVVIVGDGVATAGATKRESLAAAAKKLGDDGVARIDAVVLGGLRDADALSAVVRGAVAKSGVVVPIEEGRAGIARRLGTTTLPTMDVAVEGASFVHPRRLEGAQPGDELLVHAELDPASSARLRIGDTSVELSPVEGSERMLARSLASAKIAHVASSSELPEEAKHAAIVALSTKHRVLSPHTSMLVLETDHDYTRFGLDRTAKVDVLVVRDGQVELASHARHGGAGPGKVASATTLVPGASAPAAAAPAPDTARGNMWGTEIGDAFGAGGLGLSGIGEGGGGRSDGVGLGNVGAIGHGAGTGTGQGFGSGAGRLGGAHRARPPEVRMGATTVSGRLPPEVIQRIVRQNYGRFRLCYENALRQNPNLMGRVNVRFEIRSDGSVGNVRDAESTIPSAEMRSCVLGAFTQLSFPQPEGGVVTVSYPLVFSPEGGSASQPGAERAERTVPSIRMPDRAAPSPPPNGGDPLVAPGRREDAYDGRLREVMAKLGRGEQRAALEDARAWRRDAPGEVLALVALGEAAEANEDAGLAARAYGSILELWSYRVDLRRFAGERLERLGSRSAFALAEDAYRGAVADRPDHPSSHRLLAYALLKQGRAREAFEALDVALTQSYPGGRFAGVLDILRGDLGLAAAAWAKAEPGKRAEIERRLGERGAKLASSPSLRFVLVWETDANDVDLHVVDGRGNHAYYSNPQLPTGGRLVADVTSGYGPEGFVLEGPRASRAYPYKLRANYYARGPMGFGMGKVEVVEHDGQGGLSFDDRPFVLMKERSMVDLGVVAAPKG